MPLKWGVEIRGWSLQTHVVFDRAHTAQALNKRHRPLDIGLGVDEATELDCALEVSTLISADFSGASLKIAAFTRVVMAVSSMHCSVLSCVLVAAQPTTLVRSAAASKRMKNRFVGFFYGQLSITGVEWVV